MDYKIVQIIAAPDNIYSVYKDRDEEFKCKIVCLALIEYENGEREIVPMDMTDDGLINKVSDNLKYIC